PTPTNNPNLVYAVFTPPNVVVTSGGESSAKDFGGFHNTYIDYAGDRVVYMVIPHPIGNTQYAPLDVFQQLTAVSSHELANTVTDPIWPNGQATYTGWGNRTVGAAGEIADEGFTTSPDHYCVLDGYVVQTEWSNYYNAPVMPLAAAAFTGQATIEPIPGNLL